MNKTMGWSIMVVMTLAGAVLAEKTSEKAPVKTPAERFAFYDTNKDGVMQKSEFMAMRASWKKEVAESEKLFKWKDKNKDGVLSKEEYLGK